MTLGDQIKMLGVGSGLNSHTQHYNMLCLGAAERSYCFESQTTERENSTTENLGWLRNSEAHRRWAYGVGGGCPRGDSFCSSKGDVSEKEGLETWHQQNQ